jgi:ureidoacrylate peracid hydrolase
MSVISKAVDPFSAKGSAEPARLVGLHTAVVVVDMTNDFCVEGGVMVLPGYEALIGPQLAVIHAARAAGSPIIFVNDEHRPQQRRDREFLKRIPHCLEGSWGAQVVDALQARSDDIHVVKRRYSGFFNTDLDLTLRDLEIDSLIVMGVVTNICVRSTVHDAFFLGYRAFIPEDCVAATTAREQASSLYDLSTHYCWVSDSRTIVTALRDHGEIVNNTNFA